MEIDELIEMARKYGTEQGLPEDAIECVIRQMKELEQRQEESPDYLDVLLSVWNLRRKIEASKPSDGSETLENE